MSEAGPEPDGDAAGAGRGRRGKRFWLIAVAVVVLVVAGGGAGYAMLHDTQDSNDAAKKPDGSDSSASNDGLPEHCREDPKSTGVTQPEDRPETGGVTVVDRGVSVASRNVNSKVLGGLLLQNDSDLVARDVSVTVRLETSDGTLMKNVDGDDVVRDYDPMPYLLPGGKLATGLQWGAFVDNEDAAQKLELTADIEVGQWWQPDNDSHEFADITATIDKEQDDIDEYHKVTVDSQFCEKAREPLVGIIYRDSQGNIIHGNYGITVVQSDKNGFSKGPIKAYSPGRTKHLRVPNLWVNYNDNLPDHALESKPDWDKTEMYPYAASNKVK